MQVINAYESINLSKKTLSELIKFCKTISEKFKLQKYPDVRVILVSDDYIKELNKKFLGIDNPTNVLTFPLDNIHEIYVSVDTVRREFGNHDLLKGIAYYILHALLHLEGYSDTFENQKKFMDKLHQRFWEQIEKWNP